MLSLIVLSVVFALIAVRRIGRIHLRIWQVMLFGALAVLVSGEISTSAAWRSINLDVMLFLFGMFVVGQAMEDSGYLSYLSYRIFRHAETASSLLLAVLFAMGLFSALLMNDTIAIIGTPVVLSLARCAGIKPQPLLIALASAVTVGSVASPIGNPQNLLVALHGGVENPFVTFGRYLLPPTLLSLLAVYGVLRVLYRNEFGGSVVEHVYAPLTDPVLARLCRVSFVTLAVLLIVRVTLVLAGANVDIRLTYIALGAALPVLLGSAKRGRIVRRIDWTTLVFFAAMFVLMESVWMSGYLQAAIADSRLDLAAPGVIMTVSVVASQFLSNVPLTVLYLPLLQGLGANTPAYMALAAGATLAGMLTILGAASNVIIIENAERRAGVTLSFAEFARAGVPLTVVCVAVYWVFLLL
jgi:Na+/H+ antiporter NhaD/arsenite permease-like protein